MKKREKKASEWRMADLFAFHISPHQFSFAIKLQCLWNDMKSERYSWSYEPVLGSAERQSQHGEK